MKFVFKNTIKLNENNLKLPVKNEIGDIIGYVDSINEDIVKLNIPNMKDVKQILSESNYSFQIISKENKI